MSLKSLIKNPYILLSIFTVLIFLSSWPGFALIRLGFFPKDSLWFYATNTLTASLVMLAAPLLVIKYLFRRKASDFGFRLPVNNQYAVKITSLVTVTFLVFVYLLSLNPEFREFYMIKHPITWLFLVEVVLSFLYFAAEEFFFRGFIFFALFEKAGFKAFWITNLVFAILHLGKAPGEFFVSFFCGLVLSTLSYKTKSFVPALLVHFLTALALNLMILYLN